ncbi:MAG: DUF6941 family protein [Acidimicrobiales bacterium]
MRLTTCMLADAASQSADGKVNIIGGQWDRLVTPGFPATHPSLALVLVLRIEYTEVLSRHALNVDLMKDGQFQGVSATGQIEVGRREGVTPGAPQSACLVLTFPMTRFEGPGRYEWMVRVDGEILDSIPLEVAEASRPPGSDQAPGATPGGQPPA